MRVQAWQDQLGRHNATRTPVAGDVLDFTNFGRAELLTVDYVAAERNEQDFTFTICGVSWPNEPCDVRPMATAGTTITVRSPRRLS